MTTRPEHLTHADATSPGDVGVSSVAMESDDSDAHLHLYDSQSFSPATDAPHEPVTPDFRKEMLQPHPTGAAAARRLRAFRCRPANACRPSSTRLRTV